MSAELFSEQRRRCRPGSDGNLRDTDFICRSRLVKLRRRLSIYNIFTTPVQLYANELSMIER